MIVLDTNVISALMVPAAHAAVVDWSNHLPEGSIWTTAISVLEAREGILLLPEGQRRRLLSLTLDKLLNERMADRILPFDLAAAETAAAISARRARTGINIGVRDTQIAGIVMSRSCTFATRNIRHFKDLDVDLVDPWTALRN